MRKTVKIILILALATGIFFAFQGPIQNQFENLSENFQNLVTAALVPCQKPIQYSIGEFDTRFGLSKENFLKAIAAAEDVWEGPAGKQLFTYASDSNNLKINLIYDYRQDATNKLRGLGLAVSDTKSSYDVLKAKYDAISASYIKDKEALEARLAAFEVEKNKYESDVDYWNKRGGAPPDIYALMKEKGDLLNSELAGIREAQNIFNAEVDNINAFVVVLNRLANTLNLNVARYNEIGKTQSGEFEEGNYQRGSTSQSIDIYQFETNQKLVRVLAHELGHALGLEHLDDPKAIMYRLNQSTNIKPTASDIAAFKTLCGLK